MEVKTESGVHVRLKVQVAMVNYLVLKPCICISLDFLVFVSRVTIVYKRENLTDYKIGKVIKVEVVYIWHTNKK